ncbi:hypothetical protein AMATHDRAFT_41299 [Amanita thiersii Skay4041]|uniref:Uncharacterized protein n=1 Tax=Amanita thiersii Skay4041 TaxID=703135 RepID=A0A2A9NQ41_9AGAR|nr:hypothetical protein AMATHDRAFT_41299 [Amanita thiersii Skay4041]
MNPSRTTSYLASNTKQRSSSPSATLDISAKQVLQPVNATSTLPLKEVRAYEHSRQRAKKTAEFANLRAKKTQACRSTARKQPLQPRISKRAVFKALQFDDTEVIDDYPLFYGVKDVEEPNIPRVRHEVRLTDFVVTAKKNIRGSENDFEVVPHVRSVVVLEDNPQDIDIDEPWEYIDSMDEPTLPISYAKVVSQTN